MGRRGQAAVLEQCSWRAETPAPLYLYKPLTARRDTELTLDNYRMWGSCEDVGVGGGLDGDGVKDLGDLPQFRSVLLTGTGTAQEVCASDFSGRPNPGVTARLRSRLRSALTPSDHQEDE